MPKDTKSLGNNKAPACESRGFVRKKKKVCFFDTPSFLYYLFDSVAQEKSFYILIPPLSNPREIP